MSFYNDQIELEIESVAAQATIAKEISVSYTTLLDVPDAQKRLDYLIYISTDDTYYRWDPTILPSGDWEVAIPSAGADATTVSNIGTGTGIFKQKVGANIELKSLKANSNKINIVNNVSDVSFDVNDANLNITKAQVGLGLVSNIKSVVRTTDPTILDDFLQDFSISSRWVNQTTQKEYVCTNNNAAAANWKETTTEIFNNYIATTDPTALDKAPFYQIGSMWVNNSTLTQFVCVNAITPVWTETSEIITATNVGFANGDVFKQKVNSQLQFRRLSSTSNSIDIQTSGDIVDLLTSADRIGLGNVRNTKVNTTNVAPTSSNDSSQGYSIGSRWVDGPVGKEYVCTTATNPAIWVETTGSGGGGYYKYTKIYYVDPVNGLDTNDGSYSTPFKTITYALTIIGNTGECLQLAVGTYSENVVVNEANFDIVGIASSRSSLVNLTGNWTFASSFPSSSVRVSQVGFSGTITHTGSSGLYFYQVNSGAGTFTSSGTGFFNAVNCLLDGTSLMSFTGSKTSVIFNCNLAFVNLNNATGVLNMTSCQSGPITISSGLCVVRESFVFSATGTSNALTVSGASLVSLINVNCITPTNTIARISIVSPSVFTINSSQYDKANSVLTGTNQNNAVHFDKLQLAGTPATLAPLLANKLLVMDTNGEVKTTTQEPKQINGTTNQIISTGGGLATTTLSTPQDIHSTANTNFQSTTLSQANGNAISITGTNGVIRLTGTNAAILNNGVNGNNDRIDVSRGCFFFQYTNNFIASMNISVNTINHNVNVSTLATSTETIFALIPITRNYFPFTIPYANSSNVRGDLTSISSMYTAWRINGTMAINSVRFGIMSVGYHENYSSKVSATSNRRGLSGANAVDNVITLNFTTTGTGERHQNDDVVGVGIGTPYAGGVFTTNDIIILHSVWSNPPIILLHAYSFSGGVATWKHSCTFPMRSNNLLGSDTMNFGYPYINLQSISHNVDVIGQRWLTNNVSWVHTGNTGLFNDITAMSYYY